jgi:hypothetical protein
MYKITVGDKTMVGCNEDAWRESSVIWFENAKKESGFSAAFTGSRKVGADKYAPQSGMNEKGLVFSRLAAYYPQGELQPTGKIITNEVEHLTDILHTCETIEDVKRYIEQYNYSFFIDDVFLYIERSGKYLVVEPFNMIEGNEPYYVLSNFCPSVTDNENARKLDRYRKGEDFLGIHKMDTSISFCTALSDTMHVCRSRNGDGTLLTSIWDSKNGLVNLYFYHNYDSTVQFNLAEELAKGDHILSIPGLFPKNPEYERFLSYITPFNVPALRIALVFLGGILGLLSFIYLLNYFTKRKVTKLSRIKLAYSMLNVLLLAYLFVLVTNINIYYFDAPYRHYSSGLISLSSYVPLLLAILMIPLAYFTIRFVKINKLSQGIKSTLVFNNLIYVLLIVGFVYWGLYEVFN